MIVLSTDTASAGGDRTKPVDGLVLTAAAAHTPAPSAYAVFDTAVAMHAVPTTPVIVNVNAWPSPRATPHALHPNRVPLPMLAMDAAAKAAGWSPAAPVTTGDTVSVTVRHEIVIVPVFATTIR